MNTLLRLATTTLTSIAVAVAAQAAPPELKVVGNRLENKAVSGQIVRLTGVNIPSLGWGPGENIAPSVTHAVTNWKANLIRLPIDQTRWLAGGTYLATVDSVVNSASAANAYVIIDLHRSTVASMPDDQSLTLWQQVADRYLNNPAVLFGIYNEPNEGTNWAVWRDGGVITRNNVQVTVPGMQDLLDTIRSRGANNIVVAGGLGNAADLSGIDNGYALLDTTGGNGVLYDVHAYPGHQFYNFAAFARQRALLIGECGHDGSPTYLLGGSSPYSFWQILGIADALGVNYTAWSLHPRGGPGLINDWNWTPSSAAGQFVRNALLSQRDPGYASNVANSGFETPATASYAYTPSGASWTFTGNAGIQSTWGATLAPGAQSAFLQTGAASDAGSSGGAGSMTQSVNFARPGTYRMSFLLAQRSGKSALPVTVNIDGVPISSVSYTPTGLKGATLFFPVVTAPFTINTSGNHSVKLSASSEASGDAQVLIDNVTISTSAPAVVQDEGFQLPNLSNGAHQYRPTNGKWIFAGNAGVERNALGADTAPEGVGPNSAAGPQAAFLQTAAGAANGTDGSITQNIDFGAPGVYAIAFKAETRAGKGNLPIRILVDGVQVSTVTPTTTDWASYQSDSFNIVYPGYHTVQFAATAGGDNQAFIDAVEVVVPSASVVRVLPVPVPAGGFEIPSPAAGHGLQPTGTPWTFTGSFTNGKSSGIHSADSSFRNYDFHHSPEGWQTAFLQSNGSVAGSFSQLVNFPAGGTYVIQFQSQRGRAGAQPIAVTVDGVSVGTHTPLYKGFYPHTSATFTVGAGNHTIAFGGGLASGTGIYSLVDAVNIWPTTVAAVNLALNKTVTASSTVTTAPWGLSKLTDGVAGTTGTSAGWSSNSNNAVNHTEWVRVDLGSTNSVGRVVLYPRDDAPNIGVHFPIDFTIEGSTDGIAWTNLVTQTGYSVSTPPSGPQSFQFATTSCRYVRVTGTSLRLFGSIYRMQFAEMEVY